MTRTPLLIVLLAVACMTVPAADAATPAAPAASATPEVSFDGLQRRQSKAQQDADSAACQSMASGQATSSETWAQIFTACMGGRGYLVQ